MKNFVRMLCGETPACPECGSSEVIEDGREWKCVDCEFTWEDSDNG